MHFPRRPVPADREGRYLVERIDEAGITSCSWETAEAVARLTAPTCGLCCHPAGIIHVIGKCEGGRLNGRPLSDFDPVFPSEGS